MTEPVTNEMHTIRIETPVAHLIPIDWRDVYPPDHPLESTIGTVVYHCLNTIAGVAHATSERDRIPRLIDYLLVGILMPSNSRRILFLVYLANYRWAGAESKFGFFSHVPLLGRHTVIDRGRTNTCREGNAYTARKIPRVSLTSHKSFVQPR